MRRERKVEEEKRPARGGIRTNDLSSALPLCYNGCPESQQHGFIEHYSGHVRFQSVRSRSQLGPKIISMFFFSDPGNPIFSDELNFYDETFFFRRKRPFREKADDTNLGLDRVIVLFGARAFKNKLEPSQSFQRYILRPCLSLL